MYTQIEDRVGAGHWEATDGYPIIRCEVPYDTIPSIEETQTGLEETLESTQEL